MHCSSNRDAGELHRTRYAQPEPEPELKPLLERLKFALPLQPLASPARSKCRNIGDLRHRLTWTIQSVHTLSGRQCRRGDRSRWGYACSTASRSWSLSLYRLCPHTRP
jgi:hypothetical protein